MDYQTGLCFFNFLIIVFSIPDSTQFYSVNLDKRSFEEAQIFCKSDGFLTNMPNHEETLKIVKVIEGKQDKNSTSFWIGLKKDKTHCVQKNITLKGFYWTVDNSTEFELNKWKKEPSPTCTSALCGLLSVEYRGSTLASWGLAASSCKQQFPFICKHKGPSENMPCSPPQIFGSHDIMQKMNDPYTLQVICIGKDTFTLTCSRSTGEWKLVGVKTGRDIQGLCLECQKGYKKGVDGNCIDVNECEQSNICKFICFNTPGSYACMCVDDLNNFQNEDSEICKKAKTVSLFNSTADATNKVQDKPTSSSLDRKPPPSSQPASDSTTETGVHTEKSPGDLSNILIPVIIALLIFVVLVVITVAIVKHCLMRHAKKRAKERAATLKESMALNASDSMEKMNEK